MRSSFPIAMGLCVALTLGVFTRAAAQGGGNAEPVRNIFAGCDADAKPPAAGENPRERKVQKAPTVDKITQRSFASFSLDDLDQGVPKDMSALCWARLDGVWRATGQISLDRSRDPREVWSSDVPELIAMANGTYTTPNYVVVAPSENPEQTLRLSDGLADGQLVEFRSEDGILLTDVLKRGGKTKTYRPTGRFAFGDRLTIDVTRTGRVRLTLGQHSFVRPRPGVSQATMASQVAADDAFLLSYNLENLSANRRGYDIVKQDPFFLLQNPRFEVFAKVNPKNYYITEKRTVPVGFSLVQEVSQGMVYRKSLVASEKEYQSTISHAFGFNVGGSGTVSEVPVSASAGFEATQSAMNSMRQSQSVAQAFAYSRSKQYALVVDHPYITLSPGFIDAVEDARRHNRYRALIENFGTHYAYAVTYGAAAKMTHSYSEKSYTKSAASDNGFSANAGGSVFGIGGSAHYSRLSGKKTSSSGTVGNEGTTFVAVGGNGSWDQNGYSAGSTPYPILLDLRPIHELLNPMNFPGEPEIYETVRRRLQRAIAEYLGPFNAGLSAQSLLPAVVAPPPPPPVKAQRQTFNDPKLAGYWLDSCARKHGDCRTHEVIDAYCRQKGFDKAVNSRAVRFPFLHQSMRIKDNSLCTNAVGICRRFSSITCERRR